MSTRSMIGWTWVLAVPRGPGNAAHRSPADVHALRATRTGDDYP